MTFRQHTLEDPPPINMHTPLHPGVAFTPVNQNPQQVQHGGDNNHPSTGRKPSPRLAQHDLPSQGGQSHDRACRPPAQLTLSYSKGRVSSQTPGHTHTRTRSAPLPSPLRAKYCSGLPEIPSSVRWFYKLLKAGPCPWWRERAIPGWCQVWAEPARKGLSAAPPHTGSSADNSWQPAPLTPGGRG